MLEIFDVTATDPSLLVGEPAPRPAPRSRHCSAPSLLRRRNLVIYLSNNIFIEYHDNAGGSPWRRAAAWCRPGSKTWRRSWPGCSRGGPGTQRPRRRRGSQTPSASRHGDDRNIVYSVFSKDTISPGPAAWSADCPRGRCTTAGSRPACSCSAPSAPSRRPDHLVRATVVRAIVRAS